MVQAASGDFHELGHGAVRVMPESFALRAQVILAGPAEDADPAYFRRGFTGDAIPLLESLDALSGLCHHARKFMPQDHGNARLVPEFVAPHVHIAAAHGNGAHFQERIFFPNCRHPYVPQLNGPVLVFVMNHGRHFLTHPSSLLYAADYLTQHCNDIPIGSMESVGVDDQGRPQNHQRGPTLG